MTGLPARRIQLASQSNADADWTARIALGGAAAFTVLLACFGVILYNSWSRGGVVDPSITKLNDRTERIASGQESLTREITSLRTDLRQDRADRVDGSREVAVLRARVGELSTAVTSLREQAEKLEAGAKPAAAPVQARPDPAVAELRERIDVLQRKLDRLAAGPVPVAPAPAAAVPADVAVVKPAPAFPVDEIEQEVRDMQTVIEQQRRARAAEAQVVVPPPALAQRVVAPAAAPRASGGIADPLAPMVSKSQPRIAPTGKSVSTAGPVPAPSVSRVPSEPVVEQTVRAAHPEARVSGVGVNSAMKAIGPLGLPFDAIGNLLTAIGEGLDTLLTGQEYIARPSPDDEPSTARAAR